MIPIVIAAVYFVICIVAGTKLMNATQEEKRSPMTWLASAAILIAGVVLFFAVPYMPY